MDEHLKLIEQSLSFQYPNGYYLKEYNHLLINNNLEKFIKLFGKYFCKTYDIYTRGVTIQSLVSQKETIYHTLDTYYLVCKYYFPLCSLENVLKILLTTSLSFIKDDVRYYTYSYQPVLLQINKPDEFGIKLKNYINV